MLAIIEHLLADEVAPAPAPPPPAGDIMAAFVRAARAGAGERLREAGVSQPLTLLPRKLLLPQADHDPDASTLAELVAMDAAG